MGVRWGESVFMAGWLVNWTVNPVAKVQNFVMSGSESFCSCKPTHEQTCHCLSHCHSCKTDVPRTLTWTFPTLQTVFAHQVTAHLHTQLQRIHLIQFFTRYVPTIYLNVSKGGEWIFVLLFLFFISWDYQINSKNSQMGH